MKKKTEQNAAGAPQTGRMAGAGAAGFLKKNWKWLVPVACVAVLGGVWLLKPKADKPASVDTSYVETAPEQRDLVNALSGTGTLKPANTYNVKSLVSGKVLTCSFEEGDNVEEGDVLYTVDSSDATTKVEQAGITLQQAQRNYDKTVDRQYVRAEVAGVVSSLKVAKGDEVTSGQEVAVIRDNSKMTLALEFPAADAAGFSVGQSADVTLDGTFETLTGTITAVTGTDALSTGNLLTRTVTISVRNAGGLTTAQAATATVNGVSSIGAANFQYQAERTLTTLAAGTVTAIHAREGDSVNKDDIVLQISGDDLSESIQSASETLRGAELSMQSTQDTMNNYTITSPISGTIIEKAAKVGDALSTGSDLCTIYDLSYLEMTINVDELQVSSLSVGQTVQVTADAVQDRTYEGVVTRVSMKGDTSGGTTTYPVTVRIDETDGLRPGMNANAEIVVAQAKNALAVPNAAVVRGSYVLVTQDSPSAVNADPDMVAPDGFVYVKVKLGVSDSDYTQVVSGLTAQDTVGYDAGSSSLITTICLVAYIAFIFLSGRISDKVGRKKMLIIACVGFIIFTVPAFYLLNSQNFAIILIVELVMCLLLTINDGTLASYLTETFPTDVRYSGFALSFNLANAIFGGSASFISFWLIDLTGNAIAPAWYMVAIAVVAFIAMCMTHDHSGKKLDDVK